MESTLSQQLKSIYTKIELLASKRDEAKRELRQVREEKDSIEKELLQTRELLRKSQLDVEYLAISHKLAESPQSIQDAREKIKSLIRRVNKAIRLLEDDARL